MDKTRIQTGGRTDKIGCGQKGYNADADKKDKMRMRTQKDSDKMDKMWMRTNAKWKNADLFHCPNIIRYSGNS